MATLWVVDMGQCGHSGHGDTETVVQDGEYSALWLIVVTTLVTSTTQIFLMDGNIFSIHTNILPAAGRREEDGNTRAGNEDSRRFYNHGEGPYYTKAFSWLKAPTRAFTFKTLFSVIVNLCRMFVDSSRKHRFRSGNVCALCGRYGIERVVSNFLFLKWLYYFRIISSPQKCYHE